MNILKHLIDEAVNSKVTVLAWSASAGSFLLDTNLGSATLTLMALVTAIIKWREHRANLRRADEKHRQELSHNDQLFRAKLAKHKEQ